jgi:hypothetical protein
MRRGRRRPGLWSRRRRVRVRGCGMGDPIENRKGRMVGERPAARSPPAAVVVEPGALRVRVSGVRGLCFPGAPLSVTP